MNDEPGDTLNANEFWKAIVRDYYLGKGGYAYIHRQGGAVVSLHYVQEQEINVLKSPDPIFKDFDLEVGGTRYQPYNFLKVLRNTVDGATGVPLTMESSKLIETAYAALVFERNAVRRGGCKRGYLKSEKRLDAVPCLGRLHLRQGQRTGCGQHCPSGSHSADDHHPVRSEQGSSAGERKGPAVLRI